MKKEVGEIKGKGMEQAAPQRGSLSWVLCVEAFIFLLQEGILGKGFGRILISSPGVNLQGHFVL